MASFDSLNDLFKSLLWNFTYSSRLSSNIVSIWSQLFRFIQCRCKLLTWNWSSLFFAPLEHLSNDVQNFSWTVDSLLLVLLQGSNIIMARYCMHTASTHHHFFNLSQLLLPSIVSNSHSSWVQWPLIVNNLQIESWLHFFWILSIINSLLQIVDHELLKLLLVSQSSRRHHFWSFPSKLLVILLSICFELRIVHVSLNGRRGVLSSGVSWIVHTSRYDLCFLLVHLMILISCNPLMNIHALWLFPKVLILNFLDPVLVCNSHLLKFFQSDSIKLMLKSSFKGWRLISN